MMTIEEIFRFVVADENHGLKPNLQPYGRRLRMNICSLDIESADKLSQYVVKLYECKLVSAEFNRWKPILSHVEKRLLTLIKTFAPRVSELYDYFVVSPRLKREKVLENLYLKILENRGFIKRRGENIKIVKLDELVKEAEERVNTLRREVIEDELLRKVGFLVSFKKRDPRGRVISIEKAVEILSNMFKHAFSLYEETDKRRLLNSVIRLSLHVEGLINEIQRAIERMQNLIESIENDVSHGLRIIQDIKEIINKHDYLRDSIELDLDQLEEYNRLKMIKKRLQLLREMNKQEIQSLINKVPNNLRKEYTLKQQEFHYNIQLFLISKLHEECKELLDSIENGYNQIRDRVERLEETYSSFFNRIKEFDMRIKDIASRFGVDHSKITFEIHPGKIILGHKYELKTLDEILNPINELDIHREDLHSCNEKMKKLIATLDEIIRISTDIKSLQDEIISEAERKNLYEDEILCITEYDKTKRACREIFEQFLQKLKKLSSDIIEPRDLKERLSKKLVVLKGILDEIKRILDSYKSKLESTKEIVSHRINKIKKIIEKIYENIKLIKERKLQTRAYELCKKTENALKRLEDLVEIEKKLENMMKLLEQHIDPVRNIAIQVLENLLKRTGKVTFDLWLRQFLIEAKQNLGKEKLTPEELWKAIETILSHNYIIIIQARAKRHQIRGHL